MNYTRYLYEIEKADRGEDIHNLVVDMCSNCTGLTDEEFEELLPIAVAKIESISTDEEIARFRVNAFQELVARL